MQMCIHYWTIFRALQVMSLAGSVDSQELKLKEVSEFWLISAPGEKTCQQTWDVLNNLTAKQNNLSTNFKFHIPELKVDQCTTSCIYHRLFCSLLTHPFIH